MTSLKSKLFIFLLRYRNLFKFQWQRKPEITFDTSIPELRDKTKKAGKLFGKLPKEIEHSAFHIGDMYAEWVMPSNAAKDKAILYFHGGGYVLGSAEGHRTHIAKFVKGSNVPAMSFDYRLAPEHPYPAALEDALTAYRYLLDQGIEPANIVFVGDSAGGGLCLATLLAARENDLPIPAAAAVLSPWTDLKCTGDTLTSLQEVDALTWTESWHVFAKYYVADSNPELPTISPLYGDLTGLPPILIYVGGHEVLLDDSVRFADKARAAGVDITLRIGEGMFHCYPVCAPMFPEATAAMAEICGFIAEYAKNK